MVSVRRTIVDAVLNGLNEITPANGFAIDLLAEHVRHDGNNLAGDPTRSRHRAFVMAGAESKSFTDVNTRVQPSLDVVVDLYPSAAALPELPVADVLEPLVEAVETRLLQMIDDSPMLGVEAVVDVSMRWEAFRTADTNAIGAAVNLNVQYRHDLRTPSVYGGASE